MYDHVDPAFAGSFFICGNHHATTDHDAERGAFNRRRLLKGAVTAPIAAAALGAPGMALAQTRTPSAGVPKGPMVIEAGWVLAWANNRLELLRDASILVRDDKIEEVRTGRIRGEFARVRMPDQVVLPGFISGHTHACSATPTRGIIEGGRSFARPLELVERLTDDEMDALTAFNVWELLRGGCTTHLEMALSFRQAESYVRVARKWGVRGYPGSMIPGIYRLFPIWFRQNDQVLSDSVAETLKEIQANLEFGRKHNRAKSGRILPQIMPHATDTHTPETMKAMLAAATELGNGFHIHLAQSPREAATVKRLWGASPAEWLDQLGLFEMPVFGAHMTGIDWKTDGPILVKKGVVYSHCPSGGGAGGGTQPYPEALGAGVKVNIGIDTHSKDFIENAKLAVMYGQARFALIRDLMKDAAPPMKNPTIWTAIEGSTVVSADALKRPDLGRISAGATADLIGVNFTGPLIGTAALPPEPLNNLLYANGLSVRNVMTDGVFQIYNGRLTVDDEAKVTKAGGEAVARIWRMLEQEDPFKPTPR